MTDWPYEAYRDWKGWASEDFGKCNAESAVYFAKELRRCGFLSLADVRVIELGFGNGAFAAWASAAGLSLRSFSSIAGGSSTLRKPHSSCSWS